MDFILVDTNQKLAEQIALWKKESILAIDLECENNLHYYGSYISIIQISSKTQNWIVDVLSLQKQHCDFTQLCDVLTDSAILKLFHDVDFDFRVLHSEFGIKPSPIFDSKVAAHLLGKTEVGLGSLLLEYFGITKQKKFQRADWTKRPIRKDMLSYAMIDTAYLISLYEKLVKELKDKDRYEWALEEFESFASKEFIQKIPHFKEMKGIYKLSPQQLGVFKELFELREHFAKKVNRPVHFILRNALLFELSQESPQKNFFESVRGVHPIVKKEAHAFEKAIQKGLENPIHLERPKRKSLNQEQKKSLDTFLQKRDTVAHKLEIQPSILATKDQLLHFVIGDNTLKKWQKDVLGL